MPKGIANPEAPVATGSAPVLMDQVTVRGSKHFEDQLRELDKVLHPVIVPPSFQGGGMFRKKIGNQEIEIGASSSEDLLKEDAKYKDKTPMFKVDILRLRF